MSEPQIELREAQPYLGISERLTAGVPEFADRVFPELFGWLWKNGIQPAGPPFIRVVEMDADGEPVELEVGVPVANGAGEIPAGDGRVRADALPAGRWLTYLHVGPYRSETAADLADAREKLMGWTKEQELSYTTAVEHFRVGPVEEPDFTKWETEFAYLLA
jgi:effector-binding domain-containing protein